MTWERSHACQRGKEKMDASTGGAQPRWRARLFALAGIVALGMGAIGLHAGIGTRPALAATTLRQLADAKNLKMGTAVTASTLTGNARYGSTAAAEFNALTPGNEMKWGSVEPNRGQFNWSGADQVVATASAHNQVVRGHTLVWHNQLPGWLTSGSFTGPQLLQIMQQHIATEVGRYAGKLISWDVVNEPFNDDGSMRSTIFSQGIGPSYIADALTAARQADPTAKLYLNDYNIEGVNAKSTALLNLVTSLKQQGVPIDGVGIQTHLILGQVPSDFAQNMARFAALGLDVWLSEIDVRMNLPADATKTARQASDYGQIVHACLAVSRCVGMTVWGFTDFDSWVPSTFPGQGSADIWDQNIDPKPAVYNAVSVALGGTQVSPSPSPAPSPTATTGSVATTPMIAANSPWYNEEQVRLATTARLTSLSVTIVIQRTTGVSFSGQYNTVGGQVLQSNTSTTSAVTYQYGLSTGQTLAPGSSYAFAAQASGSGTTHPTSGDTFSVTFSTGGASTTLAGHF
jgi:endo-1,4-beta-xylanase